MIIDKNKNEAINPNLLTADRPSDRQSDLYNATEYC